MAVAPASLWEPARASLKARSGPRGRKPTPPSAQERAFVQRVQAQVVKAVVPRFAVQVSDAYRKLRDSMVHGDTASLNEQFGIVKAQYAVSYSTPAYDEFEHAMTKLLTQEYVKVAGLTASNLKPGLAFDVTLDLNERIIPKGLIAHQVTNMSDTAKKSINKTIKQGIADGLHPSVIAKNLYQQASGWAGLDGDISKSRAYTIARTETAMAFNVGTLAGYENSGLVDQVEVFDGSECGWLTHNDPDLANGKIVTMAEAKAHPIAHPNCLRAFGAVVQRTAAPQPKPATPAPPPEPIAPAIPELPFPDLPPGVGWDIPGLDEQLVLQARGQLDTLLKKYPDVKIDSFSVVRSDTIGLERSDAGHIIMRSGNFDPEAVARFQQIQQQARLPVYFDSSPTGIVRHAFGRELAAQRGLDLQAWFDANRAKLLAEPLSGLTVGTDNLAQIWAEAFSAAESGTGGYGVRRFLATFVKPEPVAPLPPRPAAQTYEQAVAEGRYANPKQFAGTYGYGTSDLEVWADQMVPANRVAAETDALENYAGSGYRDPNNVLRGKPKEYGMSDTEIKRLIDGLDSYFAKSPGTPDAVVVHRGAGSGSMFGISPGGTIEQRLAELKKKIGKDFEDGGFMSTAGDKNAAFSGIQLELTVPKGHPALTVSLRGKIPVAAEANYADPTYVRRMGEAELLLPRGTRIRITKVEIDRSRYDVRLKVYADVLPV